MMRDEQIRDAKIAYLCDRKECEVCNNMDCMHTLNIEHAVNFTKACDGKYMESIRPSITLDQFIEWCVADEERIKVFCVGLSNEYVWDGPANKLTHNKIYKNIANRKVCFVSAHGYEELHISVE